MKILFIEWASFGNADMKDAFTEEGHEVVCFPFSNKDARRDEEIEKLSPPDCMRPYPTPSSPLTIFL